MPFLLNPWFLAGLGALLFGSGSFIDKTGEGIDSASKGAIKIAIAAFIIYYTAKKAKMI